MRLVDLRAFMWRKIEPKSTFVEKNDKYQVWAETASKLGDQRRPRVHQLLRCYNLVVLTITALPGGKYVFTVSADTAHKEKT